MALIINRQLFGKKKRNLYITAFIWRVGSANEMEQKTRGNNGRVSFGCTREVGRWEVGGEEVGAESLSFKYSQLDRKVGHTEVRSCD